MDCGAFPPEINSGRMYTGPGCRSMLAADMHFTAASYRSVISDLTGAAWPGPAAVAMTAAAAPYAAWLTTTGKETRTCVQTSKPDTPHRFEYALRFWPVRHRGHRVRVTCR